ncbi:hypothetical protein REPUB_Repub18cG0007400 [Reevesia pubescens]
MKKRGCESISLPLPDSKKLNHTLGGVKLHKKDGVKKPKMDLKQGESDWSRKATISGPITKDEEEVVKTFYALAGMFPDGDSLAKNKLSGESIEVKSSAPPDTMESPVIEIEVKKKDTNSVFHPQAAETVPSSTIDESCTEAAKHNSLDEPTSQDQSDMPGSKQFHMEPDSSISQMRLNTTNPSLVKSEPDAEKSSCIPSNFHVLSELILETGLKQPKQQLTNLFERKPKMAFGVTASESQMTQQYMIKEPRKNGLALWPGLSSTVPLGARTPGSSQTCSLEGGSSTQKVLKVTMDRKSMKRCAAHINAINAATEAACLILSVDETVKNPKVILLFQKIEGTCMPL